MLSFFDRFKVKAANELFERAYYDRDWYRSIRVEPPLYASYHREMWICFPGFFDFRIDLSRAWGAHNILPKKGIVYLINGPYSIAGFTPQESIDSIQRLANVVDELVTKHPAHTLNIFSISAGTYPGFYFANTRRANRLIAIAPGPRMGQGIYTSIFSQTLKRRCIESGYPTWREYDAVIAECNQENNLQNLPSGNNLMIFGGLCDRVIQNSGTREIVTLCRIKQLNPSFSNYWLFDHTALGAWLGGLNKIGLDPYLLRT
jgi:hypothetical protein